MIRKRYLDGQSICHPDYIPNMNLTPVWTMVVPKNTIDHVGSKAVKVKSSPETKSCITVVFTNTASEQNSPKFVIFKGKRGARIDTNELLSICQKYVVCSIYTIQKNSWMDKDVIHL